MRRLSIDIEETLIDDSVYHVERGRKKTHFLDHKAPIGAISSQFRNDV